MTTKTLQGIRHYPALRRAARNGARTAATNPDPRRAVEAALAELPPALRNRARVSATRPAVGHAARCAVTLGRVSVERTEEVTR